MIPFSKSPGKLPGALDLTIGRIQNIPFYYRFIPGLLRGKVFASGDREILTDSQLNHHVHIVGASGYGKTVLIHKIIKHQIEQGRGVLFIDLKGERETLESIREVTARANRSHSLKIFDLKSVDSSTPYNLLNSGTPTQLRDRIMSSLTWSEEYYRNISSSFLLKLLVGLCWLKENKEYKLDLHSIYKALRSIDDLEDIVTMIPLDARAPREIMEDLVRLAREGQFKELAGLRSQIESLILSDFAGLLSSNSDGIDLFKAIQEQNIIVVTLDSRRYGETAKAVGRFILQDLKSTSARIDAEIPREQRKPFSVIVDEFSDLAQEDFIGFLDRARSSKMSIVVAHQELCDLQRISPEFAGRLMGNTSTVYAFLQKRPESAETLSKMIGTQTVWKETIQVGRTWFLETRTGGKSLREVEEFIIHPNVIKSQRVGECVAIKKYPTSAAFRVKVKCE